MRAPRYDKSQLRLPYFIVSLLAFFLALASFQNATAQSLSCPFNVSGRAIATPAIDGLLIARYARDLRDAALVAQIAPGVSLTNAQQTIANNMSRLDVDGDTQLTTADAIIIERVLLGYGKARWLDGLTIAQNALRKTADSIEVYINAGCPPPDVPAGNVFYVRVDGGTAAQCNGKANAAYPGSGSNQACAWVNPMIVLPNDGAARIAGGDTLIIGPGEYMIGYGAPGAVNCSTGFPYDCVMQKVPSGPSATRRTRILGAGYNTGCAAPPQLWGNERLNYVVNLQGSNNVELSCLEITDHSSCIEFYNPNPADRCRRGSDDGFSYPYGPWASIGLAAADSTNVVLNDLNIHGLANRGVFAARLTDWTMNRVRIAANGWGGWEGDLGRDTSSNSGTIAFYNSIFEWNGCGETYPGKQPYGCWAQEQGGYGDGVGVGFTGGDWIFEDVIVRYNTSDGIDLLYHDKPGSITMNRVHAHSNAGNQLKTLGTATITNSVIVGNCNYFTGKPFASGMTPGDACRASGDVIAMSAFDRSQIMNIVNSTIVGEGNVAIVTAGPWPPQTVEPTLNLRNNIFIGYPKWNSPSQQMADTYVDIDAIKGNGPVTVNESHSLKQSLRNAICNTPNTSCVNDVGLVNAALNSVDPRLKSTSPAIDSGKASDPAVAIPTTDFFKQSRPFGSGVDRGAVEYRP